MIFSGIDVPKQGLAYELVKYSATLRDVKPEDILARSRGAELFHLRFSIIWALRQYNPRVFSYPNIARRLGYLDHTSVMYGFNCACALRDSDHHFRNLSDRLLAFAQSRVGYLSRESRPRGGWGDGVVVDDLGEAA
jgi:chromosomal replication initiation ATPase DnaA